MHKEQDYCDEKFKQWCKHKMHRAGYEKQWEEKSKDDELAKLTF